jgi:hypothetical protein
MRCLRNTKLSRVGVIGALLMSGAAAHAEQSIILWSWERPDDLRNIAPSATQFEVAYLVATIKLHGAQFNVVPRRQPLRMNPQMRKTAVIRIEVDDPRNPAERKDGNTTPTPLDDAQATKVVQAILQAVHNLKVTRVQIDFDARHNEREFYKVLLEKLHKSLPPHMELSMTALASWCLGDNWILGLPVAEKVPMVFRLGVDHDKIARDLADGKQFCPDCQSAVGVSIDEPALAKAAMTGAVQATTRGLRTSNAGPRRVYVFNPKPWTKSGLQQVFELVHPK